MLGPAAAAPLRERGTSKRRRHGRRWGRVLVVAGVAVAAASVTATWLAASASHAPSPSAAVASAVAKTSAGSYHFSLDSAVRLMGREIHSDAVSGAFDPRHELGTELLLTARPAQPSVRAQIRFAGKYVYTWISPGSRLETIGKPWNKSPVPSAAADGTPGHDVYGFVSDQPVSPAELSGVLRSAGTIRDEGPASGPGWTGTRYAFTARFPGRRESVTGTVYVDQRDRIRRLVTVSTQGRVTTDRDLTFGDFGAPVPVTAPTVSQVAYTSKPYWGFFF